MNPPSVMITQQIVGLVVMGPLGQQPPVQAVGRRIPGQQVVRGPPLIPNVWMGPPVAVSPPTASILNPVFLVMRISVAPVQMVRYASQIATRMVERGLRAPPAPPRLPPRLLPQAAAVSMKTSSLESSIPKKDVYHQPVPNIPPQNRVEVSAIGMNFLPPLWILTVQMS